MRISKQKTMANNFKKHMTSAATRRKRLSVNIRRKVLWRQRTYVLSAILTS
ncbi:hypothetical protein [Photobacterium indicum]|jgi:hypothetical protein|uniref:hypothetical protein n=1 Tax=Photobacterium indicum TaxID=81447 RepID=UPI00147405CC|nr:hypothetical protein [Photobacterium indicum]